MAANLNLSVSDQLKYANLQMAAEAFLVDPDTKRIKLGSGDCSSRWQ